MKLLHLDSSALSGNSVTRELTAAIVARWQDKLPQLQVEYRDLDSNPLPHLTARSLAQVDSAEAADAARTMEQFLAADVLVIGAPMYNFSIPSTLKAWIDRVAVAGKTFPQPGDPEVLADGLKSVHFRYRSLDESSNLGEWQDEWPRSNELPLQVRIHIESREGPWPPLLITLNQFGQSGLNWDN